MILQDFAEISKDWVRTEGIHSLSTDQSKLVSVLRSLSPLFKEGTDVYEADWDLLVVIDGCRTDTL